MAEKQSNNHDAGAEAFRRLTASKLPLEEAGASVVRKEDHHYSGSGIANRDIGRDDKPPRLYEWEHYLQVWRLPEGPVSSVEAAGAGIRRMTISPSRNKAESIYRGQLPTPKRFPFGRRIGRFEGPENGKKDSEKEDPACGNTFFKKESLFTKAKERKEIDKIPPRNVTRNKDDYTSLDNTLVSGETEINDAGLNRVVVDNRNEMEENLMENSKSSDRTGKVTCQIAGEIQKHAENHQSLRMDLDYYGYPKDKDDGDENIEKFWHPGYQETTPIYYYNESDDEEYRVIDQCYYLADNRDDKAGFDEMENSDYTDGYAQMVMWDGTKYKKVG